MPLEHWGGVFGVTYFLEPPRDVDISLPSKHADVALQEEYGFWIPKKNKSRKHPRPKTIWHMQVVKLGPFSCWWVLVVSPQNPTKNTRHMKLPKNPCQYPFANKNHPLKKKKTYVIFTMLADPTRKYPFQQSQTQHIPPRLTTSESLWQPPPR